jgi:uncharacterized protein (DUF1330 family)
MAAYVVFEIRAVHDADALTRYRQVARPTIAAAGGRVIVARGRSEKLEGNPPFETVIVEFPDFEKAQAWYRSAAYQESCKLRKGASDVDAYIVDGIAPM